MLLRRRSKKDSPPEGSSFLADEPSSESSNCPGVDDLHEPHLHGGTSDENIEHHHQQQQQQQWKSSFRQRIAIFGKTDKQQQQQPTTQPQRKEDGGDSNEAAAVPTNSSSGEDLGTAAGIASPTSVRDLEAAAEEDHQFAKPPAPFSHGARVARHLLLVRRGGDKRGGSDNDTAASLARDGGGGGGEKKESLGHTSTTTTDPEDVYEDLAELDERNRATRRAGEGRRSVAASRSLPHRRTATHQQSQQQRPSLLSPPSLTNVTSSLAEKEHDGRNQRRSRSDSGGGGKSTHLEQPKSRPTLTVAPPSMTDVTAELVGNLGETTLLASSLRRGRKKPVPVPVPVHTNQSHGEGGGEEEDDDATTATAKPTPKSPMDRYFSKVQELRSRSRSRSRSHSRDASSRTGGGGSVLGSATVSGAIDGSTPYSSTTTSSSLSLFRRRGSGSASSVCFSPRNHHGDNESLHRDETQSVHPDMLRPGSASSSLSPTKQSRRRSKTPSRRSLIAPSPSPSKPGREKFSRHEDGLALDVGAPVETRIVTPMDLPQRSSRHEDKRTENIYDDVETPHFCRRASLSGTSVATALSSAASTEPVQFHPPTTPGRTRRTIPSSRSLPHHHRGGISSGASATAGEREASPHIKTDFLGHPKTPDRMSPRTKTKDIRDISSPGLRGEREGVDASDGAGSESRKAHEGSSRHRAAGDQDLEEMYGPRKLSRKVSSRAHGGPDGDGSGHPSTPSPRKTLVPYSPAPKTPTYESLSMSGTRMIQRSNSADSSSPGSAVSDPSVERILKMLDDISPASSKQRENTSPGGTQGSDATPPSSKSVRRTRRIKINPTLLSDDDDSIAYQDMVLNAVAAKGGRIELTKKEMLDDTVTTRDHSKRNQEHHATPVKSPATRRFHVRSINSSPSHVPIASPRNGHEVMKEHASAAASLFAKELVSPHWPSEMQRAKSHKNVVEKTLSDAVTQVGRAKSSRNIAEDVPDASCKNPSSKRSVRLQNRISDDDPKPEASKSQHIPKTLPSRSSSARSSRSENLKSPRHPEERKRKESQTETFQTSNLSKSPSSRQPTASRAASSNSPRPERESRKPHASPSPASGKPSTNQVHEKYKVPARSKSERSSSSHDGAQQSLHRSRSSRSPKESSSSLHDCRATKLEASSSSLSRKSASRRSVGRSASLRPDDEPIAVNPVEGRKVMKLHRYQSESSLLSTNDAGSAHEKGSFAQLQIPGIDCDQATMAVQYEDF